MLAKHHICAISFHGVRFIVAAGVQIALFLCTLKVYYHEPGSLSLRVKADQGLGFCVEVHWYSRLNASEPIRGVSIIPLNLLNCTFMTFSFSVNCINHIHLCITYVCMHKHSNNPQA